MPNILKRKAWLEAMADPANQASDNEREIAQRLLAALDLQRVQTIGPPITAYFCGDGRDVFDRVGGHYCYTPDGARSRQDAEISPWGNRGDPVIDSLAIKALRGGIAEDNYSRRPAAEGEGIRLHCQQDGWTLVAWWDRSGDRRHGSIAAFALHELYGADAAEEQARRIFPAIFRRIDLHLGRTIEGQALRARVIRVLAAMPQERWNELAQWLHIDVTRDCG